MNRFSRMMGEVTSVANNLPEKIESILKNSIGTFIEIIAIALIASSFNWKIFALLLVASFLNYGISQLSEYYRRKHEIQNSYELDWEMRTIEYTIESSYHHIASNGATDMLFDRYFALKNQHIATTKKREIIDFTSQIATSITNGVATFGVKLLVGYMVFE
jgi:hypothetical protein